MFIKYYFNLMKIKMSKSKIFQRISSCNNRSKNRLNKDRISYKRRMRRKKVIKISKKNPLKNQKIISKNK